VSKRTKDIGVAKAQIVRQTLYYYGLERRMEDLKARSRGVKTEPARSFSGERGLCICVVANILTNE
jgi:hypothetical protein